MSAKVLFVSNLFPNAHEPARGVFNLQQIRHLTQLNPVRVVAPVAWFPIKGKYAPPAPVPLHEQIEGLQVWHPRHFYLPKLGRCLNARLYALALRPLLTKLRAEFPFDVIFVNWAYPDACGISRIAADLQLPFVASLSGSDANVGLTFHIRRRQILNMIARARAVTVRSQALRQLLLSHGVQASKLHVLYNGVDRARYAPLPRTEARQQFGLGDDERVLAYVGRLSPEKGLVDLIDAMALLRDQHRLRVRLLVIGDGHQAPALKRLAAASKLDDHILWAGWRIPQQIGACLSAADALCLPSHMEGVPNAALEAFACGLPVVGTAVGGIPEVVTPAVGLLAEPQNPSSLAQSLAAALAKPWDHAAIRAHAAQFDWSENAKRLSAILENARAEFDQCHSELARNL